MTFAYYIKKDELRADARVDELFGRLRAEGIQLYPVVDASSVRAGTDALLSLGGDGTFLLASNIAVRAGLPIIGVNFGRLGFLSENDPAGFPEALSKRSFTIEERALLQLSVEGAEIPDFWPYALNEASISRQGASMLGIDVKVDGHALPTYWADGLIVATSSGSTAYSLSVGGPICMPDTQLFIVAPISPHNLNVRPLVVPLGTRLEITFRSREDSVMLSMDNRRYTIPADAVIRTRVAPQPLRRLCAGKPNFINALRTRLLWGGDVRNGDVATKQ